MSDDKQQQAPFSSEAYVKAQTQAIRQRKSTFSHKLYLEIGGHFFQDGHASRVLPGFDPACKVGIMRNVAEGKMDIILCLSAPDIADGRVWNDKETYEETMWRILSQFEQNQLAKPSIAFNLVSEATKARVEEAAAALRAKGYATYNRYIIDGYPNDLDKIVGPQGYGQDDYIVTESDFVVVMGLGSNSGKLSTCLGQVYLDSVRNPEADSGYAKLELFPIWNLPVDHPVNLAYEAATADIQDFVCIDTHHEAAYGKATVNYNRDVEAFPILSAMIQKVSSPNSPMRAYQSPTDMGINHAKEGIVDDAACIEAAYGEIESRIKRFTALAADGKGKLEWADICRKVLAKAKAYKQ